MWNAGSSSFFSGTAGAGIIGSASDAVASGNNFVKRGTCVDFVTGTTGGGVADYCSYVMEFDFSVFDF